MACNNTRPCPCTVDCPRHGICCACVAHHRDHEGGVPGCFFSKEGEATWKPQRGESGPGPGHSAAQGKLTPEGYKNQGFGGKQQHFSKKKGAFRKKSPRPPEKSFRQPEQGPVAKLTFCRKPVIASQCAHWRGNPFPGKKDGFPRKTATRWVAVLLGMTGDW